MSPLYSLRKEGKIDHAVLSLYLSKENEVRGSTVKLGGWDQVALAKGEHLDMFTCPDSEDWGLHASQITLKDSNDEGYSLPVMDDVTVSIDPMFRYIHVPKNDFTKLKVALRKIRPDLDCPGAENSCRFVRSCKNVRDFELSIEISDPDHRRNFTLSGKQLLVEGGLLKKAHEHCYVAIFSTTLETPNWYLGQSFLDKYYAVYDMTPYEEHGLNFIQVGLGLKNPYPMSAAQQYDSAFA
mmetsp:Transcript_3517/g.6013  ORF Transcript_3517/g.6013 Transcript_3517/m.6013 type:complete len:239 (-) Transcript_3517:405-1121(-)